MPNCPECNTPLPEDAPLGLCPNCLMRRGRAESETIPDSGIDSAAGAPATAPEVAGPGTNIGRYKLLQKLGEGGFGVVFMAEQREPIKRRVALKIIKQGMDTRQVIARFEAERQALALMDHPNIAKVLDAGATETGRPYFVMELVRGIPITKFCDEQKFSTRQRLALFKEICSAVQHAHQKGIIHRDLKPSNILVGLDADKPVAKVIDFGIAKATQQNLTDKTLFTRFDQFVGTPLYISPEQAELSPVDIDTRSDIYSLGVILYELLTGKPPLDAKQLLSAGLDEMRRMIRESDAPKPSTRLGTTEDEELQTIAAARSTEPKRLGFIIKGDLDWIVLKALEKDRVRRYESANALRDDLERFLKDEPVSAAAPGALYKARKFARRHRRPLAAAIAIAGALVAGTVVSTWQAIEADRARKMVEREAEKSREITELLTGMMEGVKASVALGRDTTMLHEIVDRTAARIGTELKTQPEAEAYFRSILGGIYRDLGDYDKSEEMHRRALELLETSQLGDHADVAHNLSGLAATLLKTGRLEEAEELSHQVLAMRLRLHGDQHPMVAAALDGLAAVLSRRGNLNDAYALQLRAMDIEAETHGELHPKFPERLHKVARAGTELAGPSRGAMPFRQSPESTHRRALNLRRARYGNLHPEVATSLFYLARALGDYAVRQGDHHRNDTFRLAPAEAVHREALEMRRTLYGEQHYSIAISLNEIGHLQKLQGNLAEAEKTHREALAIHRNIFGDASLQVGTSLNSLGLVLEEQEQWDEAKDAFDQSIAVARNSSAKGSLMTSLSNLARLYLKQEQFEKMEKPLREIVAIRKSLLSESRNRRNDLFREVLDWEQIDNNNLIFLLQKLGRLEEVEALRRKQREDYAAGIGSKPLPPFKFVFE